MGLSQYDFLPLYSKDKNDLYNEFYKLCMVNSIKYDRITGFFGSSIFVVILEALKEFIANNGKIRIICSPVISSDDYDAILKGYNEKIQDIITEQIIKEIENLSKSSRKELELLSTLIKYGILEIKLSIFLGFGNNKASYSQLVHDKIGIFGDEKGYQVAFGGSMNETFSGISNQGNLESFSVYTNWDNEKDRKRVEIYNERFNNIWNQKSDSVITYDFPDEALKIIRKYESSEDLNQLINQVIEFENEIIIEDKWYAEKGSNRRRQRTHQKAVLDDWEKKNRRGIFEMATGSGKTFTALCAIRDSLIKGEIPLIIVPSNILLSQWKREIEQTFENESVNILLCGDDNNDWQNNGLLNKFTNPKINLKRIILTTIQTASTNKFIKQIHMSEKLFVVVDEVHRSGSESFSNIFNIISGPRMGLSATPKRYRDSEGTMKILNYFENEITPKYDLFQAIKDGNLTPYEYNFKIAYLTNDEQEQWNNITNDINKKVAIQLSKSPEKELLLDLYLKKLLIERARIVKKAENKINIALGTIKELYSEGQKWLVYCEDKEQLESILKLLKINKIRSFYYISDMDSNKSETLKMFEKIGGVLVAIKCLDEGVDIPSVSHALILASSTNPREYIQRRGRVLRKSPNKEISYIIDCFVLPQKNVNEDYNSGLSIIKSEIARSYYFAEQAENKYSIIYNLNKIKIEYNINLDLDFEGGIENEQREE